MEFGTVGIFAVYLVFNLELQALFSTLQTDICLTYVFVSHFIEKDLS